MQNRISNFIRERELPEKVSIIIPPSAFLLDERVFMSLGPLKVAGALELFGIGVEVLDLSGIKNYIDAIGDYVSSRRDVRHFGITSTTPQLPAVAQIVRAIREKNPHARPVLGGPHVTLVNAARRREAKNKVNGRATKAMRVLEDMFDVLVAGDGEDAVFHALLPDAPKLIDADDPHSPLFLTDERLTELPWPARHLLDVGSYRYSIDGVPALSLIAQLGCPYACGFCGGRKSHMLRRTRTRTTENIVAEMVYMYQTYGNKGFMMYDDELNVNPNMEELMYAIAAAQKKLGVEWRLRGFIKSERFNEKQAESMYKAGFRWILVGFESGSPEILAAINKKATRDENTECMNIAHRYGLKVKALMSIGHPGESPKTINQTRDWLLKVRPDDFDVTIITCYPGTPYYDEAIRDEAYGDNVWVYTSPTKARLHQIEVDFTQTADYYKGDPDADGGYKAHVFTEGNDGLSPERLVYERDSMECGVRYALGIPFNRGVAATLYEHSMGQSGQFPPNILWKQGDLKALTA